MTASILALPNELVLNVLKFTDPADLENLSRVKIHWYRAAIPLLRLHIERKRQYTHLSGRNRLWRDVVVCILRDPDIAYYIRHLEIDYESLGVSHDSSRQRSALSSRGLSSRHTLPVGSSDAKLMEESMKSSLSRLLAPSFNLQGCTKRVTGGDEVLATMLLYTLLPRLQTFTVLNFVRPDVGPLSRTVQAIANAHRNNPETLKVSALGQLKYVDFHSDQVPPGYMSWRSTADCLNAFMALPQISAFKFTVPQMPPFPQNFAQDAALPASRLTSLIFVDYAMDQDGLCSLLARVPCLRRFCFLQKSMRTAVDCNLIFSTLRNHHGRSVQLIAFDANLKSHARLSVDLSAFEDLRMAHIPWAFLRSTLSCSLGAAILPRLRILSMEHDPISYLPNFLSLFAEGWYSCPCLEGLLLSYATTSIASTTIAETFRGELATKGLSLTVKESGFALRVLGALDEQWKAYI